MFVLCRFEKRPRPMAIVAFVRYAYRLIGFRNDAHSGIAGRTFKQHSLDVFQPNDYLPFDCHAQTSIIARKSYPDLFPRRWRSRSFSVKPRFTAAVLAGDLIPGDALAIDVVHGLLESL